MRIAIGDGYWAAPARKQTLQRMEQIGWSYASPSVNAIHALWDRAVQAARENRPIFLEHWVRGVAFEIPSVDGGRPFGIDTKRWPGLQRAVAEDFATFMSARSYFEHQVLIGSFIIDRARNRPPNSFFTWAESCSLYSGQNERQATDFHLNAMRKAHLAYLLVP